MKGSFKKSHRIVLALAGGLLLTCLAAFGVVVAGALRPAPAVTGQASVAPAGAEAAAVTIEMPAGTLELSSGSGALLDARFRYTDPQAKPVIEYQREGRSGTLLVRQPEQEQTGLRRAINRWQLRLDRLTPMALTVRAGDGVHALDLRELSLQQAEITLPDQGIMTVNLGSYWPDDVEVTFQGGTGLLVLTLPQGMGAQVIFAESNGDVSADGLSRTDGNANRYVNDAYATAPSTVDVLIRGHEGEVTLRTGLPGDLPVREALRLAKLVYSKQGAFNCADLPDDGLYLSTDMVRDLWYDYLCERGPEQRVFDGDDPLTQELAAAEMINGIRREFYRSGGDIMEGTMKFNTGEFVSATLDMLLKVRRGPEYVEFSLTHFMGSFSYSVERIDDRLHFTVENQTDLASGTHLPLRFPDAGFTQSLETLVAQQPELGDAFLLELVQSNRYPVVSILAPKSRHETQEALAEGGGTLEQTFTWSEPYLPNLDDLPAWPEYVRELEIR